MFIHAGVGSPSDHSSNYLFICSQLETRFLPVGKIRVVVNVGNLRAIAIDIIVAAVVVST